MTNLERDDIIDQVGGATIGAAFDNVEEDVHVERLGEDDAHFARVVEHADYIAKRLELRRNGVGL
jgi:hypothetical protein